MTPRLALAVCDEQMAFDHLVQLFDLVEEIDVAEVMVAIDACNVTLAGVVAVQMLEEAQARAWAVVLFDQAFW